MSRLRLMMVLALAGPPALAAAPAPKDAFTLTREAPKGK